MKKSLIVILFFIVNIQLFAQTDGISYQAVIIDPNAQEVPGEDIVGNILPNTTIAIRFTIFDATDAKEFTETQTTETDQFGMINLIIGSVMHDEFTKISWDGTAKDLRVEIDFTGAETDFIELSRQGLLFAPYAYHRNITATGTLDVDDATNLNSELTVGGPTNLNSSLDVNNSNNTTLSGRLQVEGSTSLDSSLTVTGKTDLMDSLSVNLSPSLFDGKITVEDTATFNGPAIFNAPVDFVEITVNGPSHLNGQVDINANMDTIGDETNYNAYHLLVQGSSQGIAIKVNGSRSGINDYVSFWDAETGEMWGRIEGQTPSDVASDPEYIYETARQVTDVVISGTEVAIAGFEVAQGIVDVAAAASSTTACVGLGACVTAPIPAFIISEGTNLVLKIANAVIAGTNLALTIADGVAYQAFIFDNIGVTYQSGSGDYAEWLPKANPNDKFNAGDLVGVKNGFITKSTSGADKVMVISTNPIVLGNMPQENEEYNYEKIAFMGQVPVKVLGNVKSGDYILPSLFADGFGTAVNPKDMKMTDYKKIVGVAWAVAKGENVNFVNVAVGLNTNDLSRVIIEQEEKIKSLQEQVDKTNNVLSELVPGFKEAINDDYYPTKTISDKTKKEEIHEHPNNNNGIILTPSSNDIVYAEITREQMLESIEQAKAIYLKSGQSLDEHPFWKKIQNEPAYKEEILQLMENKFENAIHTHKAINKKFSK